MVGHAAVPDEGPPPCAQHRVAWGDEGRVRSPQPPRGEAGRPRRGTPGLRRRGADLRRTCKCTVRRRRIPRSRMATPRERPPDRGSRHRIGRMQTVDRWLRGAWHVLVAVTSRDLRDATLPGPYLGDRDAGRKRRERSVNADSLFHGGPTALPFAITASVIREAIRFHPQLACFVPARVRTLRAILQPLIGPAESYRRNPASARRRSDGAVTLARIWEPRGW